VKPYPFIFADEVCHLQMHTDTSAGLKTMAKLTNFVTDFRFVAWRDVLDGMAGRPLDGQPHNPRDKFGVCEQGVTIADQSRSLLWLFPTNQKLETHLFRSYFKQCI
jgi:hypothetical protein